MDINNVNTDILNEKEIDELKNIFLEKCEIPIICNYSRKFYNLFIKNIIFEPSNDITDDLYFLGVYYQFFSINYSLAKKCYRQAIEKGAKRPGEATGEASSAMFNLGYYYEFTNIDYELAKKYYLQSIKEGNVNAMNMLGWYYQMVEGNRALAKKYYYLAIDKGCVEAMNGLGEYFQMVEKNYVLAKKYYLMAIDKCHAAAMFNFGFYYEKTEINYTLAKKYYLLAIRNRYRNAHDCFHRLLNIYIECGTGKYDMFELLQNTIEGKMEIKFEDIFVDLISYNPDSFHHMNDVFHELIISMCQFIDNNNLCIENFKYFCTKIIEFIQTNKFCSLFLSKHISEQEMCYINYFIKCIGIEYYENNKRKKYIHDILKIKTSQLFMEHLDFYYYKYLDIKYSPYPPGEGYIKTKKHFETITNKLNNNKQN
jgi:hypothetical protein